MNNEKSNDEGPKTLTVVIRANAELINAFAVIMAVALAAASLSQQHGIRIFAFLFFLLANFVLAALLREIPRHSNVVSISMFRYLLLGIDLSMVLFMLRQYLDLISGLYLVIFVFTERAIYQKWLSNPYKRFQAKFEKRRWIPRSILIAVSILLFGANVYVSYVYGNRITQEAKAVFAPSTHVASPIHSRAADAPTTNRR